MGKRSYRYSCHNNCQTGTNGHLVIAVTTPQQTRVLVLTIHSLDIHSLLKPVYNGQLILPYNSPFWFLFGKQEHCNQFSLDKSATLHLFQFFSLGLKCSRSMICAHGNIFWIMCIKGPLSTDTWPILSVKYQST